jgi:hypothetical protein
MLQRANRMQLQNSLMVLYVTSTLGCFGPAQAC